MVPEGSSAIHFDLSSKGLSWVDFMCQKFEAICVEVDKNPSLLIQETTKYVENQMSAVSVNVQKFCTDFIEDIIPSNPKVSTKCLSSSMSDETRDDIELSERSKPETESDQILHSEAVIYPLCYQESEFKGLAPNMMKKLSASSLQEENVSVESTQKDMFEKKPMGHHFDRDTHTDIPEVTWPLHETTCVGEHPKHVMRQEKALVQLHGAGVVDHAVQRSNGGIGPTGGRRVRDCPNLGDETSSRIGTMKVNFEDTVKQNDADIDGSGDVANSNIGVLVAKLEKSEDGKQNHPEKEYGESAVSISEPFIRDPPSCLKVHNLCPISSDNGKQNHPEKEYGESAVSISEPFIRDPPSCLKKGCFDEPLVVLDAANEQVAFWYENKDAQRKHMIDISLFFDIVDVDKRHNSDISDSDWELL